MQLPPPDASLDPPLQRSILNKNAYRPPRFLNLPRFAASDSRVFNFMSFLGKADAHGGKYFVPHHQLDEFLLPYFNTAYYKSRRMYLAENYQGQPYR